MRVFYMYCNMAAHKIMRPTNSKQSRVDGTFGEHRSVSISIACGVYWDQHMILYDGQSCVFSTLSALPLLLVYMLFFSL